MQINNLTKKKVAIFCLALLVLLAIGFWYKSKSLTDEIRSVYQARQSVA